jgi:acyl-CoA hydrolase
MLCWPTRPAPIASFYNRHAPISDPCIELLYRVEYYRPRLNERKSRDRVVATWRPQGRQHLSQMKQLTGRTVDHSKTEMLEVVLPNDANQLGNILGGKVMHLIDIAGAIAAHRHSQCHVVTASVDYLDFAYPIRVGQVIQLRSCVTRAFNTSMEIEVKVYLEDYITGDRRQTSSAFVTYVAVDAEGHPIRVPPLIVRTAEEKRRYRQALERRRRRLAYAARAHKSFSER